MMKEFDRMYANDEFYCYVILNSRLTFSRGVLFDGSMFCMCYVCQNIARYDNVLDGDF